MNNLSHKNKVVLKLIKINYGYKIGGACETQKPNVIIADFYQQQLYLILVFVIIKKGEIVVTKYVLIHTLKF